MLRDINMHEIVTAPYMYPTRTDSDTGDVNNDQRKTVFRRSLW